YDFIKQNNPNRLEYQLNKEQGIKNKEQKFTKKLKAEGGDEGIIEIIEGKDLQDEVRQVVEKIADLKIKDKEVSWNDFAILVRANKSANDFCNALDIAGLPYQFLSSRGLYAKPIIIDVISYLKMLDDYHESIAAYRILNLPIFNFSYRELVNFNYAANKKAWSLFTVLRDAHGKFGIEVQKKINIVLRLIEKHTASAREKNATEIIISFLNESGYLKYLAKQEDRKSREAIQYLNQFMKRAQEFEAANDDKSVKAFLLELQMEIDAGEEGSLSVDIESGPEAIKIMTVHGAKGLEFKYVFITNLVDKRFPTIERREQILIPDALIKEILPKGDIHLEEERRLFYVAMTRSCEHLYFSWAPDYGGQRIKKPSRFLIECDIIPKSTELSKKALRLGEQTGEKKNKNSEDKGLDFIVKEKKIENNGKINISIPPYFSYTIGGFL
ncbi:ATP-dependent helicase, partial [Patescibacteria group bacterium]|nr:ATP-dependent helicase [Patescibacteria group bacterium]